MSDIKMSDVFTDGEVMVTEWGDRYVLSDDFHLEIGELHQLSAAAHAINTHDAMQSRINELEKTIADMRAAGNKLAGYVESAGMSISGWTKLAHSPACPECKSRSIRLITNVGWLCCQCQAGPYVISGNNNLKAKEQNS